MWPRRVAGVLVALCAASAPSSLSHSGPSGWPIAGAFSSLGRVSCLADDPNSSAASPCNVLSIIVIADPCPGVYMNEASNSWALVGEADAPIDPYGHCA